MFEEVAEVFDALKGHFPLSLLLVLPVLFAITPVNGANDFTAFRMQQFDLHGSPHGSYSALVNVEAEVYTSESTVTRRCVILRLEQLTVQLYRDLIDKSAGAILILLPPDLSTLNQEVKEQFLSVEGQLLAVKANIPVYFTYENEDVAQLHSLISQKVSPDQASTAAEALLSSSVVNGFQMVVNGPQSKALGDMHVTNIQGKLSGVGIEEQLPTIAIVAHYDAFGVAPNLATGADSNGSGVVALLEIARLLSKLYTNSRTHAKFNFLFVLTGAGKFNYQGSKKYIEDQIDNTESSLLADVSFVLCLDSIGSTDQLYMHVSKPPKDGSIMHLFQQELQAVIDNYYSEVMLQMVHKKINLADDMLAWEHERYSIRRLPALTLSHYNAYNEPMRNSVLDHRLNVDVDTLTRNIDIVCEALARLVYNTTGKGYTTEMKVFHGGLALNKELIGSWLDYVSSIPRAAQLLHKDHEFLSTLELQLDRDLKEMKRLTFRSDKREPEFVFYDSTVNTIIAYSVKPAIFDLFLAVFIAGYLGVVYVAVTHFGILYDFMKYVAVSRHSKVKSS